MSWVGWYNIVVGMGWVGVVLAFWRVGFWVFSGLGGWVVWFGLFLGVCF